jgi:hypothetical protein
LFSLDREKSDENGEGGAVTEGVFAHIEPASVGLTNPASLGTTTEQQDVANDVTEGVLMHLDTPSSGLTNAPSPATTAEQQDSVNHVTEPVFTDIGKSDPPSLGLTNTPSHGTTAEQQDSGNNVTEPVLTDIGKSFADFTNAASVGITTEQTGGVNGVTEATFTAISLSSLDVVASQTGGPDDDIDVLAERDTPSSTTSRFDAQLDFTQTSTNDAPDPPLDLTPATAYTFGQVYVNKIIYKSYFYSLS